MPAPNRPANSLVKAKLILAGDDLGDHELAEATAHAVVAATEHLATIAQLMDARVNGPRA